MANTEFTDLRRTIGQLRQCVGTLRSRYGDAPAVRRLLLDVDRLEVDTDEFAGAPPVPVQQSRPGSEAKVIVPDTPYDPSLWEGADDEGVGGYHGERR